MEAKTKKKILIWGIIILVLLNLSSLATIWYHRYQYAHTYPNNMAWKHRQQQQELRRQNKQGHIHYLSKDLNLSDTQQLVFDSIWHYYAGQRLELEKQLETKRQEMSTLLSQQQIDTAAFHRLSASQAELMQELNHSMLAMNMALRKNLTASQMQSFLQKVERLNSRRGSRYSSRHRNQVKKSKSEK